MYDLGCNIIYSISIPLR